MVLLIIIGVFVVGVLLNAWRLDRKAAAQGLVYVPVKQKAWLRQRTRMVLVDKDKAEEEAAERLFQEQQEAREAAKDYDPYRWLPSMGRRRKNR